MTPEEIKQRFPNASPSFIARNCALFGGMVSAERKPDPVQTLVRRTKAKPGGKRGVVVCVTLIALRTRCLDSDNLVSGFKKLRDCIAISLGVDDGDKRIRWEYGFAQTSGREQTIVRLCLK